MNTLPSDISTISAVNRAHRSGQSFTPKRQRNDYMRAFRLRDPEGWNEYHRNYMRDWRANHRQYIRDYSNRRNRRLRYRRNWMRAHRAAQKQIAVKL